mgnify:CR=1 FL=1
MRTRVACSILAGLLAALSLAALAVTLSNKPSALEVFVALSFVLSAGGLATAVIIQSAASSADRPGTPSKARVGAIIGVFTSG